MGPWVWGEVAAALVLILAGGITWWLGRGCVLTNVGAAGAMIGGVVALGSLAVMLDLESAVRFSVALTALSGAWLFAFATAGWIKGQRAARAAAAAAANALQEAPSRR